MVSWDVTSAVGNRLFPRFVRKTKVKRLQGINNQDFDEVVELESSQTSLKAERVSERGKNYELNGARKRNMNAFVTRTVSWKRTLTKERSLEKAGNKIAYNTGSSTADEKDADNGNVCFLVRRDPLVDTKTGKVMRRKEVTELLFSELFETSQDSLFVNDSTPATPASLYGRRSFGQSHDPAATVLAETMEIGVSTNQPTLNVSADNAWTETESRTSIKTILIGLFARLKPEKKTKVRKLRL